MKQILQSYRTGELWLAEVPSPKCLTNGVKVITHSSLVSAGTEKRMIDLGKSNLLQKAMKRPDQVKRVIQKIKAEGFFPTMEQVKAKLNNPVPLGYSACGIVIEVGHNAAELSVGQRVACAGVGYANHAEVITVPKTLVVPLPDNVNFEEGSFCTLGAIAMQAVRQADVHIGEIVGVIGLGLLGNLVTQMLSASGCRVVGCDIDNNKLELALNCGAELAGFDMQALSDQISNGQGLDTIIIAAGSNDSNIIKSCPSLLRHKGKIVVLGFVGMDCPHQEFYEKELELKMSMSYGPGRYDSNYEEKTNDYPYPFVRWTEQRNMEAFLNLISKRKIDVGRLISHRFDFDNALEAYRLMETQTPYLGIALEYKAKNDDNISGNIVLKPEIKKTQVIEERKALAVVGAGSFVNGILSPILKDLKMPVKYVVSNRGSSALQGANQLNASIISNDISKILQDEDISHVLIATRHCAHAEQAEAALRAGKIVHVEKPLCVTKEELALLKGVIAETGSEKRIFIGFNRRCSIISQILINEIKQHPTYPVTIMYRINAGALESGHWFYDDPGGRLISEGCHFTDYCEFLAASPVTKINCSKQGGRDNPFDSFIVTLSFENDSQATVIYTGQGDRALRKERVEVFQNKMCWINDDWSSLIKYANGKKKKLYSGKQEKGWKQEIEHFLGIKKYDELISDWNQIVNSHENVFKAINDALGQAESATKSHQ